jgi:hypothetical protein
MVVNGAVFVGLQMGSTIQSRVARCTYAFSHTTKCDEMNPERKQHFQQTSLTLLVKKFMFSVRFLNSLFGSDHRFRCAFNCHRSGPTLKQKSLRDEACTPCHQSSKLSSSKIFVSEKHAPVETDQTAFKSSKLSSSKNFVSEKHAPVETDQTAYTFILIPNSQMCERRDEML